MPTRRVQNRPAKVSANRAPPRAEKPEASGNSTARRGRATTEAFDAAPGVDGRQFLAQKVVEIRARVQAGQKVVVGFDIDDTLVDTRPRTIEIARRFAAQHGPPHGPLDAGQADAFARLTPAGVSHLPAHTARGLEVPLHVEQAFVEFWRQHFFTPALHGFDAPMPAMKKVVEQLRDAGADLLYLTGRWGALAATTREQLAAHGYPDADEHHVVTRPDDVPTTRFKVDYLKRLKLDGQHVALYVTESKRDIAVFQAHAACECLLLVSPQADEGRVWPATAHYPSVVE